MKQGIQKLIEALKAPDELTETEANALIHAYRKAFPKVVGMMQDAVDAKRWRALWKQHNDDHGEFSICRWRPKAANRFVAAGVGPADLLKEIDQLAKELP